MTDRSVPSPIEDSRDSGQSSMFVRRSSGLVREISAGDALMANLLLFSLFFAAIVMLLVPFSFPGANLPLAVIISVVPAFLIGTVYLYFAVAMPRSGGDYVYISRTLHPSIGLAANLAYVCFQALSFGLAANWVSSISLAGFFGGMGTVTGNSGWSDVAAHLAERWPAFGIGSAVIIISTAIVLSGLRRAMRVMKVCFYVGTAAMLAGIAVVGLTGHSTFVERFNQVASYRGVLTSATEGGFVAPGSWTEPKPTLMAVALLAFTMVFVMAPAYTAGEIRSVARSLPIAVYGTVFGGALIFLIMTLVAVHTWGNDFLASIYYVFYVTPDEYPLSTSPDFNTLATIGSPHVWVVVLFGLAFLFLPLGGIIFTLIVVSRCLFAWSFDRLMPAALARVTRTTHSPLVAVAAVALASEASLVGYTFFGSVRFISGATMGFISAFATTALAATLFPLLRPDMYRRAPLRWQLGRVPVISIVGGLGFASLGAMVYAFLTNDVYGANVTEGLVFLGGVWIFGFTYYWVARAIRRRQGIDVRSAFAELPPE